MSISELLLTELDQEIKTTRETLTRVPDADNADFKPHPKSMKLGSLAPHVAQLAEFGVIVLTTRELDFSKNSMQPLTFESPAQLVKAFDANSTKLRAALAATPDSAWLDNPTWAKTVTAKPNASALTSA